MNFAIILESIKFYKLKHERAVQLGFVLLLAVNILVYVLPIGDSDFSGYYSSVEEMLQKLMEGRLDDFVAPRLTAGNFIFLGTLLTVSLINAFASFLYATLFIGERENRKLGESVWSCLAALPRLALIAVPVAVALPLTICLGFIPVIIFAMMMYFLPVNLSFGKNKLAEAMRQSFLSTQGRKLFIFIEVMILSFILSIPQRIIAYILPNLFMPVVIISSFFIVLQVFAQGRMMGILYLIIVKKAALVVPSKPADQG